MGQIRDKIDEAMSKALHGSPGMLARDVQERRPTTEEMVATLIDGTDAQTNAIYFLADVLDTLVSGPQAR